MRRGAVRAFLLVLAVIHSGSARAQAPFDENWTFDLRCSSGTDGSLPYRFHLAGRLQGGLLHAERGAMGAVDGRMLTVHRITGNPAFATGAMPTRTAHVYYVRTQFTGRCGEGDQLEQRLCKFLSTRS